MPDPTQATCAVNIYAACSITEEKNCVVENINDYLGTLTNTKSYPTVQTFNTKLERETSVVLTMTDELSQTTGWNYMRVYLGSNYFYYFIIDHKRVGVDQVRFFLKMDTVNTYWNFMKFEDTTHIMREHKDRFRKKSWSPETPGYLDRIVDRMPEDIAPELFKGTDTEITEANGDFDWYLVYKTSYELDHVGNNPLHCYLCCGTPLNLHINDNTRTIDVADFPDTFYIYFRATENSGDITLGTTITLGANRYYAIYCDGYTISLNTFDSSGTYIAT